MSEARRRPFFPLCKSKFVNKNKPVPCTNANLLEIRSKSWTIVNDPGRKSFTLFNAKPFTIVQDLYKLDIREIFNRGIVHVFWSEFGLFSSFLVRGAGAVETQEDKKG